MKKTLTKNEVLNKVARLLKTYPAVKITYEANLYNANLWQKWIKTIDRDVTIWLCGNAQGINWVQIFYKDYPSTTYGLLWYSTTKFERV